MDKRNYKKKTYQELVSLASKRGVYEQGMKKKEVIIALEGDVKKIEESARIETKKEIKPEKAVSVKKEPERKVVIDEVKQI